jgi:SAM-dependent methyltransferase
MQWHKPARRLQVEGVSYFARLDQHTCVGGSAFHYCDDTMQTAEELKKIFHEGWNIPVRVDNYVHGAEREFAEGPCCDAWRSTLDAALEGGRNLRILDMGTGPGSYACLYAAMGHRCVGFDFSERMLAEARRRAERMNVQCEFVFGDAESPPFEDGVFDAVSSRHLLFNLPRPGVALREWVRLLKPGGRLILIGHESEAESRPRMSKRAAARQRKNRLLQGRRPGWSPKPGYHEAVSQCPLFSDCKPNVLHALMEAIGLEGIHKCWTGAIYDARRQMPRTGERSGLRPFVLVGTKTFGK